MKATIQDGELRIGLDELCGAMKPEDRAGFAEFTVFNEKLLECVCETVAGGSCFNDDFWFGEPTVERLRLKLLPLMPQVIQELIAELLQQRDTYKRWQEQYRSQLWDLQRAWPEPKTDAPDAHKTFDYSRPARMTPEQVKSIIEAFEAKNPEPVT